MNSTVNAVRKTINHQFLYVYRLAVRFSVLARHTPQLEKRPVFPVHLQRFHLTPNLSGTNIGTQDIAIIRVWYEYSTYHRIALSSSHKNVVSTYNNDDVRVRYLNPNSPEPRGQEEATSLPRIASDAVRYKINCPAGAWLPFYVELTSPLTPAYDNMWGSRKLQLITVTSMFPYPNMALEISRVRRSSKREGRIVRILHVVGEVMPVIKI